jgi:alpha-beta hydrolase superfamily lysophospholipase
MKYLELFKTAGISDMYNVFIPDMRNSGNSQSGHTYMGWEFAEDTLSCIKHLQEKHGQKNVILYGFSMGSMAISAMYLRPELKNQLETCGVTVEKIIMDSPLSNARDIMVTRANTEMKIPRFMTSLGMTIADLFIEGDLDMLALRNHLSIAGIPVLVLQSKADPKTPWVCYEKEQAFFNENVKVAIFEDAYHVAIYPDARYKAQYTDIVSAFIKGRP